MQGPCPWGLKAQKPVTCDKRVTWAFPTEGCYSLGGPVRSGLRRPEEKPESGLLYEPFSFLHSDDCIKPAGKPD